MTEKYDNLLNILYGPASEERSANDLEKICIYILVVFN